MDTTLMGTTKSGKTVLAPMFLAGNVDLIKAAHDHVTAAGAGFSKEDHTEAAAMFKKAASKEGVKARALALKAVGGAHAVAAFNTAI